MAWSIPRRISPEAPAPTDNALFLGLSFREAVLLKSRGQMISHLADRAMVSVEVDMNIPHNNPIAENRRGPIRLVMRVERLPAYSDSILAVSSYDHQSDSSG